jgi:acyl carrier protein
VGLARLLQLEVNDMSDTMPRIRATLADVLCLIEDEVNEESNLLEDLGADSLDIVDITIALEEEFSIEIPDDEIEDWKTVSDIEKTVQGLR